MTHKNKVRSVIANAIDGILKNDKEPLKALIGVRKVVDELQYDLSLLIGELVALDAIKNNKTKE